MALVGSVILKLLYLRVSGFFDIALIMVASNAFSSGIGPIVDNGVFNTLEV